MTLPVRRKLPERVEAVPDKMDAVIAILKDIELKVEPQDQQQIIKILSTLTSLDYHYELGPVKVNRNSDGLATSIEKMVGERVITWTITRNDANNITDITANIEIGSVKVT